MIPTVKQLSAHRSRLDYRLCSSFVLMAFVLNCVIPPQFAQAQNIGGLLLPNPGSMMAPSPAFVPLLIKGMKIHPENPLQFDFIVDSGHTQFDADQMKAESNKLIKYFFAALTMPKDDLWVNLSPYEEGRIISSELSKTELGRDMLAQDYILKQLTASFLSPDSEVGAKFWKKVYAKAQEQFGTTDIPINTLNKVWIMPESATIFENGQAVYIVKSHLKVMLEEDYNARSLTNKSSSYLVSRISEKNRDTNNEIRDTFDKESSQIMREIILPEIEREVNEGQHFAPLRQIYHSLLLAKWYKQMIKDTLLSKAYVDQKKVGGIEVEDKEVTNKIYNLYVDAYKKGAYTFIREDYDELSKEMIPRKYLTGGFKDADPAMTRTNAQEFASVGERFNVAAGAAGKLSVFALIAATSVST